MLCSLVSTVCRPWVYIRALILRQITHSLTRWLARSLIMQEVIKFKYASSYTDVLSNLKTVQLKWKGKTFTSSEAVYQWEKARFHGLFSVAEAMACAASGKEAKLKSFRSSTDGWNDIKEDVMYGIAVEKCMQCAEYRKCLKPDVIYVEDTDDRFWGRGPSGHGDNAMGRVHGEIAASSMQLLLVGDAHVRDLGGHVRETLRKSTPKMVHVDTKMLPGATTSEITAELSRTDLGHYTHVVIVAGMCDITTRDTAAFKETPRNIIDSLTRLSLTTQQRTTAQVLIVDIPPKATPETPKQIARASNYNVTEETAPRYNQTANYVNRHSTGNVRTPSLWKQGRGKRYGNGKHFRDDCVHLNESGKKLLATSITERLENL